MSSDLNPACIITDKNANYVGVTFDGTNYRLCADVRPAAGVAPEQPVLGSVPLSRMVNLPLLSNGVADMTVNGNVTNKTYSCAPAANTTITHVHIAITSTGILFNGNAFGGVGTGGLLGTGNPGTLVNGLVLAINVGGVAQNVATFNTNDDLFTMSGAGNILSVGSGSIANAYLILNQPFAGLATDLISITVRDNMTTRNIYLIRAFAKGIKTA